ncbi:ATP-binding protein [Sporosarcina psychrophila]|uniref:AlbA family DNA-binding domain-containing protein n=1 Tax=Sporosarcina psychrophila TaxID=1476 RepID=UPI0030CDB498
MHIPIEYRIQNETESITLDFKKEVYGRPKKQEFIKDVAAFANAITSDTYRYIVIGVKETNGEKEFVGVNREDFDDVASYQQIIDQNIEPNIPLTLDFPSIQDKTIAIFKIGPCINPPYVLKRDTDKYKQGLIFIRKGTTTRLANRQDLDIMFQGRQKVSSRDIRVGLNKNIDSSIEFSALSQEEVDEIPSRSRERHIIEELKYRKSPMYRPELRFYSNHFSLEEIPVHQQSDAQLQESLKKIPKNYRDEDGYYLFEQKGSFFNLYVFNEGSETLRNCKVTLTVPRQHGLLIANKIHPQFKYQDIYGNYGSDYPYVEKTETSYTITENIEIIRHKQITSLFDEDIRLALKPEIIGDKIPIQYEIHAENLPDVITGELEIRVTDKK